MAFLKLLFFGTVFSFISCVSSLSIENSRVPTSQADSGREDLFCLRKKRFKKIKNIIRCTKYRPDVVALLQERLDIKEKDQLGNGPLHIAANSSVSVQVLQIIMNEGADLNERNGMGKTPFHFIMGNLEGVRLFLREGADPNIRDNYGRTPFHMAVKQIQDAKVIELFLERDIDVNMADDYGVTPFLLATRYNRNPEVIEMLIKKNANTEMTMGVWPFKKDACDLAKENEALVETDVAKKLCLK